MRWTGEEVTLKISGVNLQKTDSFYDVNAGDFHRSSLHSDFAITVLATENVNDPSRRPRVIGTDVIEELVFDRSPKVILDISYILKKSLENLTSFHEVNINKISQSS